MLIVGEFSQHCFSAPFILLPLPLQCRFKMSLPLCATLCFTTSPSSNPHIPISPRPWKEQRTSLNMELFPTKPRTEWCPATNLTSSSSLHLLIPLVLPHCYHPNTTIITEELQGPNVLLLGTPSLHLPPSRSYFFLSFFFQIKSCLKTCLFARTFNLTNPNPADPPTCTAVCKLWLFLALDCIMYPLRCSNQ